MRPLALALDTSTPTLSAALVAWDDVRFEVLATRTSAPPPQTSTQVPGVFDELLAEAGASIAELRCVVAGVGPGVFTGTRVAVATMKAIAYARALPLLGAGSLEAMALAAARGAALAKGDVLSFEEGPTAEALLAAIDARKNEVYSGTYAIRRGLPEELSAPEALPTAELTRRLAERAEKLVVFGSGLQAWGTKLAVAAPHEALAAPLTPGAAEIAYLALRRARAPLFDVAAVLALEPAYLRPPEAEVARKKRELAR